MSVGDWVSFNHGWKGFGIGQVMQVSTATAKVRVYLGGTVYSGDIQTVPLGRTLKHQDLESARNTFRKFSVEA